MKNNEAYMIPGYELWCDEPTLERGVYTSKTPHIKRWYGSVHTLQRKTKVQTEPQLGKHSALKIDAATAKIEGYFMAAGKFLRTDLARILQENYTAKEELLRETINRHTERLWIKCAKDYMQLSVFNYLDGMRELLRSEGISKSAHGIKAYEDLFAQLVVSTAEQYSRQMEAFSEGIASVVERETTEADELPEKVEKLYSSGWKRLVDVAHRMKIQSMLGSILLTGRTKYTYTCNHADSTCDNCAALNGQTFDIGDAEEGVNLPPIHPNCRCTISGYPALPTAGELVDALEVIASVALLEVANNMAEEVDKRLNLLAGTLGLVWSALFERSVLEYYGSFTTIKIDSIEYRINRNNFTAVAVGQDGKLIVPENAKLYDEQLLNLMRQRDMLPEGSQEREQIETQIKEVYEMSTSETRSVEPEKPYNFYVLGGDTTKQLNEYMRQAEIDYAHMHKRYWVENLKDFYLLVRGRGEMDLKAQPEWQHSAYIYDGEIVSQDALGNINYGYFGAFCNFPKSVLVAAGGFAQWRSSGNIELEFWYTLFDDPRDTYRVLQGIDIYHVWH